MLSCYLPGKIIWVDAAGWSDLLLGVVICAIKPPQQMLMERRISTTSFQPPNFRSKKYLADSVKISDEIVTVMQADQDTCFKVCSEYILSSVAEHLVELGFKVEKVQSTGELRGFAESEYIRWCQEKGVPKEITSEKRRFWSFLNWVAENPHLREDLVKTGWASWENKWRKEIYTKHADLKEKERLINKKGIFES